MADRPDTQGGKSSERASTQPAIRDPCRGDGSMRHHAACSPDAVGELIIAVLLVVRASAIPFRPASMSGHSAELGY
jgi:hypothetical protein